MNAVPPSVTVEEFGTTAAGQAVQRYRLANGPVSMAVLTYGGVVQELFVPDRDGEPADVVLGFDDLASYEAHRTFFGALIGRYGNRIAGARFTLDGREHRLSASQPPNTLHGGVDGFDRRVWTAEPVAPGGFGDDEDAVGVRLSLHSPDGDQGFPAALDVTVTYRLDSQGGLAVHYEATNAEPDGGASTVVNLTNHSYVNLAGESSGAIDEQVLSVHAPGFLPTDETQIPTGEVADVAGSPFDWRAPTRIGDRLRAAHPQLLLAQGFDHCFVLGDAPTLGASRLAATLADPGSGRVMSVWTDLPGVQVYTANFVDGSLAGKGGHTYRQGDAICLETQGFPDAPNQPHFPTTVLAPGARYLTTTVFRFGTDESLHDDEGLAAVSSDAG